MATSTERSRWVDALRLLNRFEEVLGITLLVALGALLSVQVLLRFVFDLGFGWMEEIARMLFVWVIFLGAVAGMQRYGHIRVTAGLALFPRFLRRAVALLGDLVLFVFCLATAWYGLLLTVSTLEFRFTLQSTGLSMFWPYIIMPVSFVLQALRLVMWHLGWVPEPEE